MGFDPVDCLLAMQQAGKGGASVTVEPLSVSENGVYTAPPGKAYSPVTVAVQPQGGLRRMNFGGQNFAIAFSSGNCGLIFDRLPELASRLTAFAVISATVSLGGTAVTQTIPMMVQADSSGAMYFVAGGCNSSGVALDFIIRCSRDDGFIECQKMQYTASGTVTDLTAYAASIVSGIQFWVDLKPNS